MGHQVVSIDIAIMWHKNEKNTMQEDEHLFEEKIFGVVKSRKDIVSSWGNQFLILVKSLLQADDAFFSFYDGGKMFTKSILSDQWLEWPIESSFCQYTLQSDEVFEISDISSYTQFKDHPLVREPWTAKSYAGLSVAHGNNDKIATLFIINQRPREITLDEKKHLTRFATLLEEKIQQTILKHIQEDAAIHNAALDKARNLFLSSMSHEVRTPLNAIIGISNLLLSDHSGVDHQSHFRDMQDAANNLLFLVNQIFDFNLLESGSVKADAFDFKLTDIYNYLTQILDNEAKSKKLLFKIEKDPNIPEYLIGDMYKLRQVLLYLCDNGIKYTDSGQVVLYINQVKRSGKKSLIKFSISDTGMGIRKSEIKHIFSAFNRVNKTGEYNQYDGAGLGLAITRKLLHVMGTDIDVQSEPGKGSTFSFALPFEVPTSVKEIREQKAYDAQMPLNDRLILLVEDNLVNAMIAKKFLTKWGATVTHVLNGRDAVDQIAQNRVHYDLVLMDIQMPIMNGLEACKIIRNELKISKEDLPIISVTASILQDSLTLSLEAGMNDSITKPFVPEELLQKILHLI